MNKKLRMFDVNTERDEINKLFADGWKIDGMITSSVVVLTIESSIKLVTPPGGQ